MSSSDDEVPSPQLGASSSKDRQPVTPIGSESDGNDVVKKKAPRYKRSRVNWERVLSITKGPDAEMDDDQRNARDSRRGRRAVVQRRLKWGRKEEKGPELPSAKVHSHPAAPAGDEADSLDSVLASALLGVKERGRGPCVA